MISYNRAKVDSIIERGQLIENISVNEYMSHYGLIKGASENGKVFNSGKGSLGQIIEKIVFEYDINSNSEADFKEVGVELKVVPVRELVTRTAGTFSVKERIVITMIQYHDVVNESWHNNSLMKKLAKILFMFYIYDSQVDITDQIFKLVALWEPSESDLEIIKLDWQFIIDKIARGDAHLISEGDTYYLGACTKGNTKAGSMVSQPYSNELAMRRAFSLKRSYADIIFQTLLKHETIKSLKLIIPLHEQLIKLFIKQRGKSMRELVDMYDIELSKAKHWLALFCEKFLKASLDDWESAKEQMAKSGIELKTICLLPSGTPKESMSFEQINYNEIVTEEWEFSEIRSKFESKKHIWVIFKASRNYDRQSDLDLSELVFYDCFLWNMPIEDLDGEYRILWEDTVSKVKDMNFENFLKSGENRVGHIRPKAKDSSDRAFFNGQYVAKKSFWLNSSYVKKQIELREHS